MSRDYKLDTEDIEINKEELISEWIRNNMDETDAKQLYEDMINDQYHSDPNQEIHFDITIDDRIKKYSDKK